MQNQKDEYAACPEEQKEKLLLQNTKIIPFQLEPWKYKFCNSPNQQTVMQQLWEEFDHQEWSLWKVKYIKYQGEGVTGYITNNLKNGILQRVEELRSHVFAVMGVYGNEGNYEIQGVWFWKGQEIPQIWVQQEIFQFCTFTKLDPKDPAVWQLTSQYWLHTNQGDLVEGIPVYDTSRFL